MQPDAGSDAARDVATDVPVAPDVTTDAGFDVATDVPADVATDAATPDASMPDVAVDVAVDAPSDVTAPDARPDAGSSPMLLVAVGIGTMPGSYASSYHAGTWAALTTIGTDEYGATGGGVTFLADGRGLAVLRGNGSTTPMSATWAGSWATLAAFGSGGQSYLSAPVATTTGAIDAVQSGSGSPAVNAATFDNTTSAWTTGDATGVLGNNHTVPVVALAGGGAPLLLEAPASSSTGYTWTLRTGTTWSTPAAVPGITQPNGIIPASSIAAIRRTGTDQVVAVFTAAGTSPANTALVAATFTGGTWSTPTTLANDVVVGAVPTPAALAALPDGRVALAYVTQSHAIDVAVFNGTAWSALQAVPMATGSAEYAPVALARGADPGVVLELAYIDSTQHLMHTRLTDEAHWTWNTPATIDASRNYSLVSIAVAP